jgi:membrane protein YdbS with pleckstrin-like domain
MARSFHPYPAIAIAKLFLTALALSVLLYMVRDMLGQSLVTLLIVIWLITALYMLVAFLRSRLSTIELGEQSMTYQAGILSTRKVVLPYAKITEASYAQSLMQRLFGVGNLIVDTASGTPAAIRLDDVRYSDLKEILSVINSKTGADSGI